MRVIAGSARRLVLKTPEGMDTRPTLDRVKETLFNIIQDDIYGCKFLDVFSGSGGIGIEALSRGAGKAVFIEKDKTAQECIKHNLVHTHLADRAVLLSSDALASVRNIEREGTFDIVYMDPPYDSGLDWNMTRALMSSKAVGDDTLFIVEADLHSDISWIEDTGCRVFRIKEYKTNKHVFFRKSHI